MSGWTLSWFWTMDALGTDEMDGHYHGFWPMGALEMEVHVIVVLAHGCFG